MDLALTKLAAARRLRVCVETYYAWEAGARVADPNYRKIVQFLGYDPSSSEESLGGRLRAERLRRGASTVEVAVAIGVDPETVRSVERGRHRPSRRTLDTLERWIRRTN